MTSAELKSTLSEMGISQIKLANLMGVNKVTVSKWTRGVLDVPRYVEVYLSLRRNIEVYFATERNRSTP